MSLKRHLPVLIALLRRDLGERVQGSLLGFFWLLLQPILQLAVLSLVFTHLLPARTDTGAVPYAAFLALGLWPWQMFANAVQRATSALTDNAAVIGKVAVPHTLYVLARVFGALLPDLLGFALVLGTLDLFVWPLSAGGTPLLLLALTGIGMWTLAASFTAALLQVFLRDVAFAIAQLLILGFFLSPVLYARDQLPAGFARLLGFNPLAAPIETVRAGLLGQSPEWVPLGASMAAALVALYLALALYQRASPQIEDFL